MDSLWDQLRKAPTLSSGVVFKEAASVVVCTDAIKPDSDEVILFHQDLWFVEYTGC